MTYCLNSIEVYIGLHIAHNAAVWQPRRNESEGWTTNSRVHVDPQKWQYIGVVKIFPENCFQTETLYNNQSVRERMCTLIIYPSDFIPIFLALVRKEPETLHTDLLVGILT